MQIRDFWHLNGSFGPGCWKLDIYFIFPICNYLAIFIFPGNYPSALIQKLNNKIFYENEFQIFIEIRLKSFYENFFIVVGKLRQRSRTHRRFWDLQFRDFDNVIFFAVCSSRVLVSRNGLQKLEADVVSRSSLVQLCKCSSALICPPKIKLALLD